MHVYQGLILNNAIPFMVILGPRQFTAAANKGNDHFTMIFLSCSEISMQFPWLVLWNSAYHGLFILFWSKKRENI